MTEKELADRQMKVLGEIVWDELADGITISGITMADLMIQFAYAHRIHIDNNADAIRHWVESAGHDENGKFVYYLSNHILNC